MGFLDFIFDFCKFLSIGHKLCVKSLGLTIYQKLNIQQSLGFFGGINETANICLIGIKDCFKYIWLGFFFVTSSNGQK